jgi:hypothetical protein
MRHSFIWALQESFTSITYDALYAHPYTRRLVFFNKNAGRSAPGSLASVSMS